MHDVRSVRMKDQGSVHRVEKRMKRGARGDACRRQTGTHTHTH